MFATAIALAITGTTAYVFKNTEKGNKVAISMIENCVEYYTIMRMKYYHYSLIEEITIPTLTDIRVISGEQMVIIPENYYSQIICYNWNQINTIFLDQDALQLADTLLHISYEYQDQSYRIVLSQSKGQLSDVIIDLSWIKTGFCTEIENISGDVSHPQLNELLNKYAGPLGDFYNSQGIEQDPRGFLDIALTSRLLHKGHKVIIEDPIGDTIEFSILKSDENQTCKTSSSEEVDE